MRRRLRPALDASAYQVVRSNRTWNDHIFRTYATGAAVAWLAPRTVCDPACGDASIVNAAHSLREIEKAYLSDISAPMIAALWGTETHGYEAALNVGPALESMREADVMILTEVLEHLEDPDELLREARKYAPALVASSPLNEFEAHGNHEHVWGWDRDGYREMLVAAGWDPIAYQELSFFPPFYTFQLWVCR